MLDTAGLAGVRDFFYISQNNDHANSRRSNRMSRNSISYNSENVGASRRGGGPSDVVQYHVMREAMDMLDFLAEQQEGILDVLGVVLHLGNIVIDPKVSRGKGKCDILQSAYMCPHHIFFNAP